MFFLYIKDHRKYALLQLNFQDGKVKEKWSESLNAILKRYTFSHFWTYLTHAYLTSEYRDRT
jgi:hypothetical protein